MHNHRIRLAERRAALVAQAARQRAELAEAFEPLRVPLTYADKGLHVLRYATQHYMLLAGAVALAAVVRKKRWLFVLENGWLVWRLALATKRKLQDRAVLQKIN